MTHYLLFSRVFNASALDSDEEMDGDDGADAPSKRRRKGGAKTGRAGAKEEMGFFHPEDEIIAKVGWLARFTVWYRADDWIASSQFASHSETFRFPSPKDAAESFETPLFGRLAAVPREKWAEAVEEMKKAFAV